MITGDIIKIRHPPDSIVEKEIIIVDDCYRVTDDRCTMLVKLVDSDTHFEIDIKEIQSGQDI
jgi:hypothetical protein